MRDQVAREPGDNNAHWVEQTAVLYPSAEQAQSFFHESQLQWENCAGQSISVKEAGSTSLWQLDDVKAEDILISQMSTQKCALRHVWSVCAGRTVDSVDQECP